MNGSRSHLGLFTSLSWIRKRLNERRSEFSGKERWKREKGRVVGVGVRSREYVLCGPLTGVVGHGISLPR